MFHDRGLFGWLSILANTLKHKIPNAMAELLAALLELGDWTEVGLG